MQTHNHLAPSVEKNRRWTVALTLVFLALGLVIMPAAAQQDAAAPADAAEFITYLSRLNAMAANPTVAQEAAPSVSQTFTTQLDGLRAQALAAEDAFGGRMVIQDANEHVTQLDQLRQMEPQTLLAQADDQ